MFKRKIKIISLVLAAPILLIGGLISFVVYWAFFDMNRLPTGNFLTEESSPDGKYTLKAYISDGGATTSYAIRGELVFNDGNKKKKNIYWNYPEETTDVSWIDNGTVVINGHELDVSKDKYDFRRE
ncbi:DUF5412 domain-containing protein [Psychrobacillus sp. NPDC096389]|uniref:DUF5412 domain-containing protein n=1 Tax=Psychrobacillus sp. NPDC096389 TaxID=3364490 RepID=UPI0038007A38